MASATASGGGGSDGTSRDYRIRRGPVILTLVHCLFIFGCSIYLYRAGLALHATRFWWVGQGVIVLFILLVVGLIGFQLVRALSRRRYVHLLFLIIVVLSLFPTYFSLERPMQRFHLLLFGVLGMLVFRALAPTRYTLRFYLVSLNIILAVSFLDEIIQGFVDGRYYDMGDIAINLFAGTIGLLAMRTMDLDAPLPLHPQPKPGHERTGRPAPLIDLHIFPPDLALLVVPAACILLFNAAVTKNLEPGYVAGVWADVASRNIEIRIEQDGAVHVAGPDCSAAGEAHMEGNALDGYRVRLHERWDEQWEVKPEDETLCGQPFRGPPFFVRRDAQGAIYLYRQDMGRLERHAGNVPVFGTVP